MDAARDNPPDHPDPARNRAGRRPRSLRRLAAERHRPAEPRRGARRAGPLRRDPADAG